VKLSELASTLGLAYQGPDKEIRGVATLEEAGPEDISFLANPKYAGMLQSTRAGAVILAERFAEQTTTALVSENPYLDFARAVQLFAKPQGSFNGHSQQAWIHPEAEVADDAVVYPFVSVGAGARVGSGTTLFSGVYVGEDCQLGPNCVIYPNVTLMAGTQLGEGVILHAGVVLGSDGFGFAEAAAGREKFPQVGRVVVGDNVEIGANTCVDRAALGETRIGSGSKIDNLVQLGHNVQVGENCILVSQVGIAGSTKLGRNVIIAGQVGVAGHLEIGEGCRVGAKSGVGRSLPPGTDVSGIPAMDHATFLKSSAVQGRLPEMARTVRRLEKEVEALKAALASQGETNV